MNDNPYLLERMAEAHRQHRMQEAEQSRLLRRLKPVPIRQPVWRPIVLSLAHGLIAAGRRLEHAAEPHPQPACETC